MKYTIEKAEKSTVKITITLETQEWLEAINGAYAKTKSKFNIPGFRKGKVPKKVIENVYGTGVFYEEAINIALPKYYGEVLDKEPTVEAVANPEIDIKDISDETLVIESCEHLHKFSIRAGTDSAGHCIRVTRESKAFWCQVHCADHRSSPEFFFKHWRYL